MPFRALARRPFVELAPSPETLTMVCGSGRSGTTWVGDVVAAKTRSRVMFEPFLLSEGGEFQLLTGRRGILDSRKERPKYLPESIDSNSKEMQDIGQILFADHQIPWVDQELKSGFYPRRLIKGIRSNLFLGAILKTWPQIKILYLIRSPFDVVKSMLAAERAGWGFAWRAEDILTEASLVDEWLAPFVPNIARAHSLPELLAIRWCIENLVAVSQLRHQSNAMIVAYESLRSTEQWASVGSFLSDRGWRGAPSKESLDRPSATSMASVRESQLAVELAKDEWAQIRRLISVFGIDKLLPECSDRWLKAFDAQ